jgi:hypothetical protein
MMNFMKEALLDYGIEVVDHDSDGRRMPNTFFTSKKSKEFNLIIANTLLSDKSVFTVKLCDSIQDVNRMLNWTNDEEDEKWREENYFINCFVIKEIPSMAYEYDEVSFYTYVKSFFELLDKIEDKKDLIEFLNRNDKEWILEEEEGIIFSKPVFNCDEDESEENFDLDDYDYDNDCDICGCNDRDYCHCYDE